MRGSEGVAEDLLCDPPCLRRLADRLQLEGVAADLSRDQPCLRRLTGLI
jgi:hypothetical protein